ncbi:MAG TPA: cache domain-containing protein, partial [Dongiaceae bacterium]|nr:cache domain-containing protein [Dongiaceae bacterium]
MATRTLQQHILRLIGITLLVVSLAILSAVWFSTGGHVRNQISNDLAVGHGVLKRLLATREQQLLNSAEVLTADFGFKQAVASGDAATAQSALDNHGERIQADLMALVSLEGVVTVTTRSALTAGQAFPDQDMVQTTLTDGGATAVVQLDNDLYQVIMLPVKVPVPVALTVIGFRINAALAQELKQVTLLEVTFASESDSAPPVRISTLADAELETALATRNEQLHLRLPFVSRLRYVTERFPLSDSNRIYVYLSTSVDSAFTRFDNLQLEIILISLVGIGLSLLGGALFARKLTQPIKVLADLAAEIAAGHYRRDVQVSRNVREIGNLMSTFNTMQADLSEREARIIYQAHHDPLTGLTNRQHVITLLDDMLKQQGTPPLLVACVNILDFRVVND